jgi:hypothetical protein
LARAALETSFEISGTILGINATMMGTYWSTVRPDGTLYGECPQQGVLLTQDGDMERHRRGPVHRSGRRGEFSGDRVFSDDLT